MKTLFLFSALVVSTTAFSATTIICSTKQHATPHDTFFIKLTSRTTYIEFQRAEFFGSEDKSITRDVGGCAPARSVEETDKGLYIGCGSAGFLTLKIDGRRVSGAFYFPGGNIGYSTNKKLSLGCYFK